MGTAIIILLSFVFLTWFISRWLRLAASPERHFLSQDEDPTPVRETPSTHVMSIHIAPPADSDSETHLNS